eukprot:scaffold318880_cov17-Prasinocladus_malaysianus.AAC.1
MSSSIFISELNGPVSVHSVSIQFADCKAAGRPAMTKIGCAVTRMIVATPGATQTQRPGGPLPAARVPSAEAAPAAR